MRSGLLSIFLLSLVTTAAAPQTHLDELIAHAKSLEQRRRPVTRWSIMQPDTPRLYAQRCS